MAKEIAVGSAEIGFMMKEGKAEIAKTLKGGPAVGFKEKELM